MTLRRNERQNDSEGGSTSLELGAATAQFVTGDLWAGGEALYQFMAFATSARPRLREDDDRGEPLS